MAKQSIYFTVSTQLIGASSTTTIDTMPLQWNYYNNPAHPCFSCSTINSNRYILTKIHRGKGPFLRYKPSASPMCRLTGTNYERSCFWEGLYTSCSTARARGDRCLSGPGVIKLNLGNCTKCEVERNYGWLCCKCNSPWLPGSILICRMCCHRLCDRDCFAGLLV